MKKDLIKFNCDNCKKEIISEKGFPYTYGWIYIYKFSFKVKPSVEKTLTDKHFCSKACFIKYCSKQLK